MTTSMKMNKDQGHVTERILNLTLEIICLLTGEDYKVVKETCEDPLSPSRCLHRTSPNMVHPPHCLTTELTSAKKILEAINKMIELLTGEVPIRCQDVAVYFSMEEWEYLEGHKELYKDVMMVSQPALTSPDGSSNGNPPQRCPRPLYSRDPTQEDLTIPQHHQDEERNNIKIEVKDEEEEETLVRGDQPSMEEEGEILRWKQEESSLHKTERSFVWNPSERHLVDCYKEDDLTPYCPQVDFVTQNIHHRSFHLEGSMGASNPAQSSYPVHTATPDIHQGSHRVECGVQTGESLLSSLVHENMALVSQEKSIIAERPYACSECGKSFILKGNLLRHKKTHTGERPFSCSECGKRFTQKGVLIRHQKSHTGERPYFCSECGKSFTEKHSLQSHKRIHTGERPFSCSECGKRFTQQSVLVRHQSVHMGESSFECSECGKCFSRKASLVGHQKIHARDHLYSLRVQEIFHTKK